jgi:hypothetical protein
MTTTELEQYLLRLDLAGTEAAQLLGVTPRTMQRWLDGEEIPGPAEQAILAWIKLHDLRIPWKPDSRSLSENDEKQIAGHLHNAVDLAALIKRVEARGGPRTVWEVNRGSGYAVSGKIEVSFYNLLNGSFSLAYYTRRDMAPDMHRDRELTEDAAYFIAMSLGRQKPDFGPVNLVWTDVSPKSGSRAAKLETRQFPTNEAALKFACKHMRSLVDPFITTPTPSDIVFDKYELQNEYEIRTSAPGALAELAESVRKNASFFVTAGAVMLTPAARAEREKQIKALADKLDALARNAQNGSTDFQQFSAVLGELHALGSFPDRDLLSTAAKALGREKRS